jgi:succinyl-CoA synthetase alpha subunit
MEELTAQYITTERYPKPIVAYVAGRFAPAGKHMGHAGAIVLGKQGTVESKIFELSNAGVKIADKPNDIAKIVKKKNKILILKKIKKRFPNQPSKP